MKMLLLLSTIFSITTAAPLLYNGGCERFRDFPQPGTLSGWSLDSGITVSPESIPGTTGNSSCRVEFTTRNQANTDMLKSVNVNKGDIYRLSARVRFADMGARIRFTEGDELFTSRGFLNFLNPTSPQLTNVWLNFTSTPFVARSRTINVGFRFYDKSRLFTGRGLIHIDDIKLTAEPNVCNPTEELAALPEFSFLNLSEDERTFIKARNYERQSCKGYDAETNTYYDYHFDDEQLVPYRCNRPYPVSKRISLEDAIQGLNTSYPEGQSNMYFYNKAWTAEHLESFSSWVTNNNVEIYKAEELEHYCRWAFIEVYVFIERKSSLSISYVRVTFTE